MKWPWDKEAEEARAAQAEKILEEVQRQRGEVAWWTRKMREVEEGNHFTSWVADNLRGQGPNEHPAPGG